MMTVNLFSKGRSTARVENNPDFTSEASHSIGKPFSHKRPFRERLRLKPLAVSIATILFASTPTTLFGAKYTGTDNPLLVPSTMVQVANTAAAPRTSTAGETAGLQMPLTAAAQAKMLRQPTRSGQRHQYDGKLERPTFIWGSAKQNKTVSDIAAGFARGDARSLKEKIAGYYAEMLTSVPVSKTLANGKSTSAKKNSGKEPTTEAYLVNMHDLGRGAIVGTYHQRIKGVEVFNRAFNVMLDQNLEMVAAAGYLTARNETPAQWNFQDPATAIQLAFAHAGGDSTQLRLTQEKVKGDWQHFTATNQPEGLQLLGEPRAKPIIYDLDGELITAYYVEIETGQAHSVGGDYRAFIIDGAGKSVLFEHDLQAHAEFSYRVYADEDTLLPEDGPHGDVTPAQGPDQIDATEILPMPLISLEHGPISTGDPWLTEEATETSGNNVLAYADVVPPQGFSAGDFTAPVTAPGQFDYVFDPEQPTTSRDNRHAAIVNLFYVNNFLHNWFYDHGFDEAAGNAQVSNYGRGGLANDVLLVEAQDNSGFNNANIVTPADGASPRMQMFLFESKDAVAGEDYGVFLHGVNGPVFLTSSQTATFGPMRFAPITAQAVRWNDGDLGPDGTGSTADACEPTPVNAAELVGNIAVIDRGTCLFPVKVLNAQAAGAIAAVVLNDQPGDDPAPMGGFDENVTIASMGLSANDGAIILTGLNAEQPVTLELFNNRPFKDGTLDNAIIAHEWGHYISNRLIGNSSGLINNQGRSMGEGWADFHALLMLAREADQDIPGNEQFQAPYTNSTFVGSFFNGVRRVPYSTNTELNPLTFQHIQAGIELPNGLNSEDNAAFHNAGEIWASMLWDSYVALINLHGFEEAQTRMIDYLVASYKLTPIAPTYTEARDALLAAAFANEEEDYRLILDAFANRGMGLGAISPDRFSTDHAGVVESFDTDLSAFQLHTVELVAEFQSENPDGILQAGEQGAITVSINNTGSTALAGVTALLTVVSDHQVVFENNGLIEFDELNLFQTVTSAPLPFTLIQGNLADTLVIEVSFPEQLIEDQLIVGPAPVAVDEIVNYQLLPRPPLLDVTNDDFETLAATFDWAENALKPGSEGLRLFIPSATPLGPDTTLVDLGFELDSTVMFIGNQAFETDVAFETQTFDVGFAGNFAVSFDHFYSFETGFDGGVVEVSINGSPFQDVLDVPGAFFEGVGYNSVLAQADDSQALQGQAVFSGVITTGVVERETINFGTALNGNQVRFRFRVSTDLSIGDAGWLIDNVEIRNVSSPAFSCVASPLAVGCDLPALELIAEDVTAFDIDENGLPSIVIVTAELGLDSPEDVTFEWQQIAGPPVVLGNLADNQIAFVAPDVQEDTVFTFAVTATGPFGETAEATVNATVLDLAAVAPEPEPEPDPNPVPDQEPPPEVDPIPDSEPVPEVDPTPEPNPAPEVNPEPEPEPAPDVEPAPDPEPTPEVDPTPEPTPETDPLPEPAAEEDDDDEEENDEEKDQDAVENG